MRKLPLLVVEWDDVTVNDGWKPEEECLQYEKPARAIMVGWKIGSDKQNIILATARASGGECNGRRIIPRGCIRSIRRLE